MVDFSAKQRHLRLEHQTLLTTSMQIASLYLYILNSSEQQLQSLLVANNSLML